MGKKLITLLKRVKMSNDTKYYTPSIEEFHVGFEFETSYLEDYDTWKKVTLEFDDFGFYTSTWEVDSNPTEFRVKYLDKEDIESLDYQQSLQTDSIFLLKKKIDYNSKGKLVTIGINLSPIGHIMIFFVPDEKAIPAGVTIFSGFIKNKSELKRLLKQLGIYE